MLSLRRATLHAGELGRLAVISIHALLAESDLFQAIDLFFQGDFYPRSPCGERHLPMYYSYKSFCISIHALLAESDKQPNRLHIEV